jgi:hypothetical protein
MRTADVPVFDVNLDRSAASGNTVDVTRPDDLEAIARPRLIVASPRLHVLAPYLLHRLSPRLTQPLSRSITKFLSRG